MFKCFDYPGLPVLLASSALSSINLLYLNAIFLFAAAFASASLRRRRPNDVQEGHASRSLFRRAGGFGFGTIFFFIAPTLQRRNYQRRNLRENRRMEGIYYDPTEASVFADLESRGFHIAEADRRLLSRQMQAAARMKMAPGSGQLEVPVAAVAPTPLQEIDAAGNSESSYRRRRRFTFFPRTQSWLRRHWGELLAGLLGGVVVVGIIALTIVFPFGAILLLGVAGGALLVWAGAEAARAS